MHFIQTFTHLIRSIFLFSLFSTFLSLCFFFRLMFNAVEQQQKHVRVLHSMCMECICVAVVKKVYASVRMS